MRSSARLLARWGLLPLFLAASAAAGAPSARALTSQPNDPLFGGQWNLRAVGAPEAWQVGTGAGTTIAIVDSGVDASHDDLQGKVVGSVTCVGSAGDSSKCTSGGVDDNGHGTHVAGIAAAATNNNRGVAGVAPDASILAIKVLTQSCDITGKCDASGNADDVIAGINYAVDHGATVINLSLGNTVQAVLGHSFAGAVNAAFSRGVISVIAAGNDYLLPSHGSDVNAFVVGALDKNDGKASYANTIGDAKWGLMAPGGEPGDSSDTCPSDPIGVVSTYRGDSMYACLAGTSMAAPHVSGAIAILRGLGRSPQDTVDRLLSTARYVGPPSTFGAGALDLSAAVGVGPAEPPTTDSTAPSNDGGGNDTSSTSSTPDAAPAGDLGAPTSTAPASVAAPPRQRASGTSGAGVTARTRDDGGLSTGVIAVAVLMAASVSSATMLFFFRGKSWAQRTPRS